MLRRARGPLHRRPSASGLHDFRKGTREADCGKPALVVSGTAVPHAASSSETWVANPGTGDDAMKTILLATDGSPSAAHALEFACEICRETDARLEVLTVRTLAPHGDPDAPDGDHMDVEPVVQGIADDAARAARQLGVDATAHTAYGKPAAMIAESARTLGADLVVVGSHGRDRAESAVLGSVSRGLLSERHLPPVTIVRGVGVDAPSHLRGATHAS
jgi:nucleotide-binding universal stress UspA family protein